MRSPIQILHVEDNPGDIKLAEIALAEVAFPTKVSVVTDGDKALCFLRREGQFKEAPRPDLILLDLNLPKIDGREVLREIKQDPHLKKIPVIILTSSEAEQDISVSYELQANCYIRKSESLDSFMQIFKGIEDFWFKTVKLPSG